jgi:hypothetical protein
MAACTDESDTNGALGGLLRFMQSEQATKGMRYVATLVKT